MDRLLRYEKKFLKIDNSILLIATALLILYLFSGRLEEVLWYIFAFAFLTQIINYILFFFKYFQRYEIYYLIKYLKIILVAFLIFQEASFMDSIGSILYLLFFIEIVIVSGSHSKISQYFLFSICVFPLFFVYLIASLYMKRSFDNVLYLIFFIALFVCVLMGLVYIIMENVKELNNQLLTQKRITEKAKETNKNLVDAQEKIKIAHKQLTIKNADLKQAYKKLNFASSEMYIQNELLKYISTSLEIDSLMEMVTDSIIGAIGVDTCSIIIYNDSKDEYQFKIKSTYSQDYSSQLDQHIKSGVLDSFFESTQAIIDNNVEKSKYPFLDDRVVGSLMIMPLTRDDLTYGLLIAEQKANNRFTDNMQFFDGIATEISIAIHNANLYAKMEELATHDGLTKVYNRTFIQKHFSEMIKNAIMNKSCVSVALFDIDKFKRINDTYGHLFGDEVIKMTARVTEKIVMLNHGIMGRFGGEEFVIILPKKTTEEALEIVQEVHNAIKDEALYHNGEQINIDVSIGVANYPETCKNPSELLNRADLAMYHSKENGRGRITIDNRED
ncbi:diguanylate cyclase with GAF sensor [Natranaerovirga hydrolytica]|uniref:Diguanylate cyclase with GAF sensor n=1 Tax=Natranaerovirga hydrolytica TaxID=680378 RepID=A0A4R1N5E7_9FIRM|nr:diguanylate cyclase [Natranaerovirga hydrolytica]TCK98199.1 diguanylate cyclase with GAF sensor [Natranaerovirga hydrolytica]